MLESRIIMPQEPRIVSPDCPDYQLPICVVDPQALTLEDEEFLQTMANYAPRSRFKPGDLALLQDIPLQFRNRRIAVPQVWKVRFVVSAATFELMNIRVQYGNIGMDRATSLLEAQRGITPNRYRSPVIYAHGYPHGTNPSTAAWIPERVLRRLVLREPNASWVDIVTSAGAEYLGYDSARIPSSFIFPLAPDDYSHGSNIGKPFDHEEDVVHSACLAGLEEYLFVPIILGERRKSAVLDADHDVFATGG
jgi:hypothetical protein